jgi:hypothetical protein
MPVAGGIRGNSRGLLIGCRMLFSISFFCVFLLPGIKSQIANWRSGREAAFIQCVAERPGPTAEDVMADE